MLLDFFFFLDDAENNSLCATSMLGKQAHLVDFLDLKTLNKKVFQEKANSNKAQTESELEISFFYLVTKHFWYPNWVIAYDPALNVIYNQLKNINYLLPIT